MDQFRTTRRGAIAAAAGGILLGHPQWLGAQTLKPTAPVDTSSGKLRGMQADGTSVFLGIPYGADTAACRFKPAPPAPSWAGVRDCFAFGPQAPQGSVPMPASMKVKPSPELMRRMAIFRSSLQVGDESENCLVLNVFTPEASPARRRPVMVWLHGGGFALGSSGEAQYDGSPLCRAGDVVVVGLNHRLGALGFLYLGALSDEFADSGNVGQLDIVLALRWVQDNIEAFGGDPENVTIFGESGGGQKVSTLLAMPQAKGLFHKAIVQSGPNASMQDKPGAEALAGRTLTALGLTKAALPTLSTMDYHAIVKVASAAQIPGTQVLEPVVDGRSLPLDPLSAGGQDISRGIPVIIGTNNNEATLFLSADPDFGTMTAAQVQAHFNATLGSRGDAAFNLYRDMRPQDAPTYWVAAFLTDKMFRIGSIKLAELRAQQQAAPVYMYRLDWRTPILDGVMRTPHGLDVPLVFDNVYKARNLLGPGPQPLEVATTMSRSWIEFAHKGNPSQPALAWPAYDMPSRETMIFDIPSKIIADPDAKGRLFWSTMES
jgi:para-nitrobenzyl esterase